MAAAHAKGATARGRAQAASSGYATRATVALPSIVDGLSRVVRGKVTSPGEITCQECRQLHALFHGYDARLIPARGSDRSDDSLMLAEDHLQQDFRGNGVVHGDDEAVFDRLLEHV